MTGQRRDGWVLVGMAVAATSAAVASFTGLRGLALVAGWPAGLAWLLPVTIDAYAMTSARVWLSGAGRGRRFAQANAIGAIGASIIGNAAYHAISVRLLTVSWPIAVLVGAVPATVLGLTAHLHALRSGGSDRPDPSPDRPGRQSGRTEDRTQDRTGATEDELLPAAREADARYRAEHGRPITRDALRTALRIAGPRATALRRQLAAEAESLTPDRKEADTTT